MVLVPRAEINKIKKYIFGQNASTATTVGHNKVYLRVDFKISCFWDQYYKTIFAVIELP